MNTEILIVQRFFYNFREGFFDFLNERKVNFKLINSTESKGRVTVHSSANSKSYIQQVPKFNIGNSYVVFPFLLFHILSLRPKWIITEGGQNTINNLQILLYYFITKKNYIIWDLGKGYDNFPDSFHRRIYMYFYKLTLRHAAFIYTYNNLGAEYFRSLGMDSNKIVVLNNTVNTRKIELLRQMDYAEPAEIASQMKISDHIYFIFVGALLPSKNIEDLRELLDLLGPKYILIMVGDGEKEYRDKLIEQFENTNTIFTGYKKIEELAPYYNRASFSILPGLGGLSINQAMAFGLPVICRNADGAEKDLIHPDRTGFIYGSLEEASRYIKSKSIQDWKEMGNHAENLIYSEHSVENMADRFLSIISNSTTVAAINLTNFVFLPYVCLLGCIS